MIATFSPQARGRSERNFGTWQGRLPQKLRLRGIADLALANEFLRNEYATEFNSWFAVTAAQKGSAFVRARRKDLDWIFSVQHERTVNSDNTFALEKCVFQFNKTRWRNTLPGRTVIVHEHLDGRLSIRYGSHLIAQYAADQLPAQAAKRREKTADFVNACSIRCSSMRCKQLSKINLQRLLADLPFQFRNLTFRPALLSVARKCVPRS